MKGKDQPFETNEDKLKVVDLLKGIFGEDDWFSDLKREHKPIPFRKKGDIEYEVKWQLSNLEEKGYRVLYVSTNKHDDRIIVYRVYYNDGQDDSNINLRVRIITNKGVKIPDPNIYLHVFPKEQHMQIADIRIEGNYVNRGYGSLVMGEILKLAHQMEIKFITGWISSVDWDHIERSEHFYRKFGFEVELNHDVRQGSILWLNNEWGVSYEEYFRFSQTNTVEESQ